jgi:hypothetical protein
MQLKALTFFVIYYLSGRRCTIIYYIKIQIVEIYDLSLTLSISLHKFANQIKNPALESEPFRCLFPNHHLQKEHFCCTHSGSLKRNHT